MKKTITLAIHRTYPEAKPVTRFPFTPTYRLAYADETACWQHPDFSLVLQQHDAFDVYLLLLEIRVREPSAGKLWCLPLTTHRSDLHWLYQLAGNSTFRHETGTTERVVRLGAQQHRQLYSPQLWAQLDVQPDEGGRYLLVDVVVKENWLSRYHPARAGRVEALIAYLRQQPDRCRHSRSYPIVPAVSGNLHLLFTLPARRYMEMDAAVYGPVTALVNLYRSPSPPTVRAGPGQSAQELVAAVQQVVVQQVGHGVWPRPQELSVAFAIHLRKLQRLFRAIAGSSLQAFISDVRMQEAWRRLANERQEPAAVAFGLGYREQAAFNHQFKKHFGITPGEARSGKLP